MADKNHCAWCNGYLPNPCITIESAKKGYYLHFCSEKCVNEWQRAGYPALSVYKQQCFITTAVCKTFNKPDDCEELTAFRFFRDTFMRSNPEMHEEIHEYYEIAPKICAEIEKSEDSGVEIYTSIWDNYLKSAFAAIDKGENQTAHDIYKKMVLDLKATYLADKV